MANLLPLTGVLLFALSGFESTPQQGATLNDAATEAAPAERDNRAAKGGNKGGSKGGSSGGSKPAAQPKPAPAPAAAPAPAPRPAAPAASTPRPSAPAASAPRPSAPSAPAASAPRPTSSSGTPRPASAQTPTVNTTVTPGSFQPSSSGVSEERLPGAGSSATPVGATPSPGTIPTYPGPQSGGVVGPVASPGAGSSPNPGTIPTFPGQAGGVSKPQQGGGVVQNPGTGPTSPAEAGQNPGTGPTFPGQAGGVSKPEQGGVVVGPGAGQNPGTVPTLPGQQGGVSKPEQGGVIYRPGGQGGVISGPGTVSPRPGGQTGGVIYRPGQGSTPSAGDGFQRPGTGGQVVTRPGGNTSGGSRPDVGLPDNDRPDSVVDSGGSDRPDSYHPADRPSSQGSTGGSRGDTVNSRPSNHDRPDYRPSTGGARPGHDRPHDHYRPDRPVHYRPYTPVHRWYYSYQPYYAYRPVPVSWYHGVFIYGPAPSHHHHYHSTGSTAQAQVEAAPLPDRKIDRNDTFALGVHAGGYVGGYDDGATFADNGVGAKLRYRPVEAVGLELGYTVYDDSFDSASERRTDLLQPSVQLFVAPWSRVSPYISLGATYSKRSYDDQWSDGVAVYSTQVQDSALGAHGGLGLELAIGKSAALGVEARYIHSLNVDGDDPSTPGALQGIGGLSFYF
ncbi:MAG: outer membrane beta-barrel protein [Deltaproteobacteria bacterium]|nr:outer membrane beta-barrel protein [Deltaproteobacteria bacterium]